MDFASIIGGFISPVIRIFGFLVRLILGGGSVAALLFVTGFFVIHRFNPLKLDADKLRVPFIRYKYYDLMRWLLVDWLEREKRAGEFKEYGFTFFVGRQGAGKTISMVRYLEEMRTLYPNCKIVTNFGYYQADHIMTDWHDFLNIRNGTDGVIFAIDEIHSEYSAANWKDVPESLLSEISQQRKQRVKIVATAQFFSRVAKPLREQAVSVVACKTLLGRLTSTKEYDALDYGQYIENPLTLGKKIKPIRKRSFVQSDILRSCYDTYEKIKRMKNTKFLPRAERASQ